MRIKSVLRNSVFSLSAYLVTFVLGLIIRKVFVAFFSVEYLGYEGLFANIFSLLSLAELGVGGVITYSLYKEIAENNTEEICKLMAIYKYVYRIIGSLVAVIGFVLFFLLPFIITDEISNWNYVKMIFLMQLVAVLFTYFLSYRRTLFIADQKEYMCVELDTIVNVFANILRLLAILVFKNYVLYLLVAVFSNLVSNLLISKKCKEIYPYITKKTKVVKEDFQKYDFFKEIRNFSVHKISYLIYGGVDNIVISILLGIKNVAFFSNYMLVCTGVTRVIYMVTKPIQASIGNLVYTENLSQGKKIFFTCNLMFFFLASFLGTCFFVLFQPFVSIWLGESFLLPLSFVAALSLNFFIGLSNESAWHFRSAFGKYDSDRNSMVLSAAINFALSIFLAPHLGLTGVMLGTIAGHMLIYYGRIKFVFKEYFKLPHWIHCLQQLALAALFVVEAIFTYSLAYSLPVSIFGIIARFGLCIIAPNFINLVIFYRTNSFKGIKLYLHQSFIIVLELFVRKK